MQLRHQYNICGHEYLWHPQPPVKVCPTTESEGISGQPTGVHAAVNIPDLLLLTTHRGSE